MEYAVGQEVLLRPIMEMPDRYDYEHGWNGLMDTYCGTIVTITSCRHNMDGSIAWYRIDEDNGKFVWHPKVIQCSAERCNIDKDSLSAFL